MKYFNSNQKFIAYKHTMFFCKNIHDCNVINRKCTHERTKNARKTYSNKRDTRKKIQQHMR